MPTRSSFSTSKWITKLSMKTVEKNKWPNDQMTWELMKKTNLSLSWRNSNLFTCATTSFELDILLHSFDSKQFYGDFKKTPKTHAIACIETRKQMSERFLWNVLIMGDKQILIIIHNNGNELVIRQKQPNLQNVQPQFVQIFSWTFFYAYSVCQMHINKHSTTVRKCPQNGGIAALCAHFRANKNIT